MERKDEIPQEGNLKPRGRLWARRVGLALLALFVVLALFHRPIVFRSTKYFVVRLAKEQKLELDYEIGGSIFTTLKVTNLRAKPTEPGPIERLEIGTLNLRYSLVGWLRKGFPGLLKDVDLRDVFVTIDPSKSVPREKAVKSEKDAKFPALFPERMNLTNINFISRSLQGDTELTGLNLSVDPTKTGALKIQTLNIPGVHRWDGIAAVATFPDRNLVLSDLTLGPEVALKHLTLDASKLAANEVSLGFDGVLFGAPASLTAKVTDLNGSNRLNLRADANGLGFDAISKYLNLDLPLHGTLTRFALAFDGVPEEPAGWSGNVEAQLDRLAFGEQQFGAAAVKIDLGKGHATIAVSDQFDSRNRVVLNADATLPEKLDGFLKTSARGRLDISATDVETLAKAFGQEARGDVTARVDFKVSYGQLAADVAIDSAQLAAAGAELTSSQFTIHLEKGVGAQKQPVFADLVTQIRGSIASLRFADYAADGFEIAIANRGSAVTVEKLTLSKAANSLAVQGSFTLPDDLHSWESTPLALAIDLAAPDLSAFVVPGSTTKLAGKLTIRGRMENASRRQTGAFTVNGEAISINGLTVRSLGGDVDMVSNVAHFPNFGVYLDARNFVSIGGEIALGAAMKYSAWAEAKLEDLSAFAPLLAASGASLQPLAGSLVLSWRGEGEVRPARHTGSAMLDLTDGKFAGQENLAVSLAATYSPESIALPRLRAAANQGEVQAAVHWENKRLAVTELAVRQRERTVLSGSIEVSLDLFAPQRTLDALIPADAPIFATLASKDVDLKILFEQFGQKPAVLGLVNADISASGTRRNLVGSANIRASKLQPAGAPDFAPADVTLDLAFQDNQISIATRLQQQQFTLLEGTVALPLDLAHTANPDLLIPDDGPVKVSLLSRDVSLARLVEQIGKLQPTAKAKAIQPVKKAKTAKLSKPAKPADAALTGTLNTTITAEGTIRNLVANVSVRASKVQSSAAEKLAPADLALDLNLRDDRLKLSGTVIHRDIKPLTLSGDLPFAVAALRKAKALDMNTPIAVRVNLPRSPLGFVTAIVPAIRFVDGTAAIDVRVGGTLGNPELSGSAQADIPSLRMKDASLPLIGSVVARMDFTRDQITVRQFKGGVAGGTFGASGSIRMVKITEPVFDLRVVTREALVVQDDNVTARITSDLRIAGPFNAAAVSGNVLVTKSRFFKDIDILPIGLPGRPAPQPPEEPEVVSFPDPPLRDWKFDIAIKTKDPFLIQGNLANGKAVLDLRLAGTGLQPWLDGSVGVSQLMTSLPYSRLEISQGNVFFTATKPFVPQLDIRGESVIRDYRITVYIFGDANAPQAIFTSEPPLPQAEIVSLLATGATPKELAGDPNVLAGRAGLLVAQKIFGKIFKKSGAAQPKETLFKDIQFDVAAPDPRSGQQSLQVRLPVGERVVLSGGVDVGGNFRGQLKYLVRFK